MNESDNLVCTHPTEHPECMKQNHRKETGNIWAEREIIFTHEINLRTLNEESQICWGKERQKEVLEKKNREAGKRGERGLSWIRCVRLNHLLCEHIPSSISHSYRKTPVELLKNYYIRSLPKPSDLSKDNIKSRRRHASNTVAVLQDIGRNYKYSIRVFGIVPQLY